MANYRLFLISEPASAYQFADPRSLDEISAGIVRDGYFAFEGLSSRLGAANQTPVRQTVFSANIGRLMQQ
jgi:hypothetical protein